MREELLAELREHVVLAEVDRLEYWCRFAQRLDISWPLVMKILERLAERR